MNVLSAPLVTITTQKDIYDLYERYARGHIADVFMGRRRSDRSKIAVKLARDGSNNDLLAHEREVLQNLNASVRPSAFTALRSLNWREGFLVHPVDVFKMQGRTATVFPWQDTRFSVAELRSTLGRVYLEDVAWILQRLLAGLVEIHTQNMVHGAVTTDHVLLPANGEGWLALIDWSYAVRTGERMKVMPTDVVPELAPEVVQGKPVSAATDIYGAGLMAARLLGSEGTRDYPAHIPKGVRDLLDRMRDSRSNARPSTAVSVLDQWDEILSKLGVDRSARKLDLPPRRTADYVHLLLAMKG